MATYTEDGLQIKRQPEFLQEIQDNLKRNISSSIIFESNTILGQIAEILANEFATQDECIEFLYSSMDRDKATGTSLDALLYLVGLERGLQSKSSGDVLFTAVPNTTIPIGTVVGSVANSNRFLSTSAKTLSESSSLQTDYIVDTFGVTSNTTYTITVNSVPYSYLVSSSFTKQDIVDAMVDTALAGNEDTFTASKLQVDGEWTIRLTSTTESPLSTSTGLTPDGPAFKATQVNNLIPFEAFEYGPLVVASNTLKTLVSGIGGVVKVTNPNSFGTGRFTETDTEFRARAYRALSTSGSSTYSGMYTDLANIEGASNVVVLVNPTNSTDAEGLPPHSFEVIIDTPDTEAYNAQVSETIWDNTPLGIQSFGNVDNTVIDVSGTPRTVKFSRPNNLVIAVKIDYTLDPEVEAPNNIVDAIKSAVLEYSGTITTGKDIIPSKIAAYVSINVAGLADVTGYVQTLTNSGDIPVVGNWSSSKLVISARDVTTFAEQDIYTEDIT